MAISVDLKLDRQTNFIVVQNADFDPNLNIGVGEDVAMDVGVCEGVDVAIYVPVGACVSSEISCNVCGNTVLYKGGCEDIFDDTRVDLVVL